MPKLMHMHVYTLGGFGIIIAFCRLDICSTDETCNFDDVTRLNDGILFVLFYKSATKVYRSLEDSGGQVLFGVGWQWSTEEELQRWLNQSSLIWDISFFFFSFLAYALGGHHERCGFELCHVSLNKNHRNSLRSHCNFWKQTESPGHVAQLQKWNGSEPFTGKRTEIPPFPSDQNLFHTRVWINFHLSLNKTEHPHWYKGLAYISGVLHTNQVNK